MAAAADPRYDEEAMLKQELRALRERDAAIMARLRELQVLYELDCIAHINASAAGQGRPG